MKKKPKPKISQLIKQLLFAKSSDLHSKSKRLDLHGSLQQVQIFNIKKNSNDLSQLALKIEKKMNSKI